MGKPKLLLPLGRKTVIARLIDVLDRPAIAEIFVVLRPDDKALHQTVSATGATVLQPPSPPPDMRTSVEFALQEIQSRHAPADDEGWMLVPADHPILDASVLKELIAAWRQKRPHILVPRCGSRRGHPTFFRWSLAREVPSIPNGNGLNWLLRAHADDVTELQLDNPAVITDLDTPEDYEKLLKVWPHR